MATWHRLGSTAFYLEEEARDKILFKAAINILYNNFGCGDSFVILFFNVCQVEGQ